MREVKVVFPGWMVEDKSHETFVVGQVRKLALEIFPKDLKHVTEGSPGVVWDSWNKYWGVAEHRRYEKMSVFDFGCIAGYKKNCSNSNGFYVGRWKFGIDPYFYKDGLCDTPHTPSLFNDYEINRLELDVTPLIVDGEGDLFPDLNREETFDVDKTDGETHGKIKVLGGNIEDFYLTPHLRYLMHLTRRQ